MGWIGDESADELVAETVDGDDELGRLGIALDLLAQARHVDVHRPRHWRLVVTPDIREQLVARQCRAAMLHEMTQPGTMQTPQVRIIRGDGGDPLAAMGGLDNPTKRYRLEFFAQAYNLLKELPPEGGRLCARLKVAAAPPCAVVLS
jgi:hypothetical protein